MIPLRVLHVLPRDLARGAQRYAKAMRTTIDGPRQQHRTLVVYGGDEGVLSPDFSLGLVRRSGRGLDLRAVWRLHEFVSAHAPDVVVAHGGEPLKLAAAASVPNLVYYRIGITHRARGIQRLFRDATQRALLRRTVRAATVSSACRDELLAYGARPADVEVIPNGRDPETFKPAASQTMNRLLFVGHLSSTKRPDWLLRRAERVRENGATFPTLIIGDGPLRPQLERQAQMLDGRLLGLRHDIPEILAEGGVFAFPSVPEGEGMPGVLIEAALSGLPIVTTDVPGARDVVVDGTTGFVVRPDDELGFEAAILRLLTDPKLALEMGAAGREHCKANYSLTGSARKWEMLLERFRHARR